MKSYSHLSSKDKVMHNIKGVINYNFYTISNAVQNLLSNNFDSDLLSDVSSCLEQCIKNLDLVFIKHSNPSKHENETKDTTSEDA